MILRLMLFDIKYYAINKSLFTYKYVNRLFYFIGINIQRLHVRNLQSLFSCFDESVAYTPAMLLTISPAMISPATDGTNEVLPIVFLCICSS